MLYILVASSCSLLSISTFLQSAALSDTSLALLIVACFFLLVLHSTYKPIVMLTGLVARTLGNLSQDGACSLVMLLYLGNARNKPMYPSHLLKLNIVPYQLHALRSFSCVVCSPNLIFGQLNPLYYMLITLVLSKLPLILSFMSAQST
jgi:hypothetical protein